MASFMDYFSPSPRNESADPNETQAAWDSWLQDDKNRSALLQFGINLMQPFAPGQTGVGHFGQAIGAAGEAMGRIDAEDLKKKVTEEELAGKTEDREIRREEARDRAAGRDVQRELAAGRMETAAGRLDVARQGLANQREKLEYDRKRAGEVISARANEKFNDWLLRAATTDLKAENDSLANLGKPPVTVTQLMQDPDYVLKKRDLYFQGAGGGSPATAPPVSESISGPRDGLPYSQEFLKSQPLLDQGVQLTGYEMLNVAQEKYQSANPQDRATADRMLAGIKARMRDPNVIDNIVKNWKRPNG